MENSALFEKLVYKKYKDGISLIGFKDEYKNEVEELIIPDSWNVVAIAKDDFYAPAPFVGCNALKKVVLPSTLKELEEAFDSCESLTEIVFPDNFETLGNMNFCNCNSLESVKFPASLKRVGFGNFKGSPVYLSEYEDTDCGCVYLNGCLLKCLVDDYGTLEIKEGTVIIADCACADLSFSEVIFPSSLRYIGSQAFYCCDYLEKPILPPSIESIGHQAFYTENGDLFPSVHVTDGAFDKDGELIIQEELGYISQVQLEKEAERLNGYLLKLDYDSRDSYDNSDDERAECSESSYSSTSYRELNVLEQSKSLLRVDGQIVGVVFRVDERSTYGPDIYPFFFDKSYGCSMTLGYSASHSSHYVTLRSVTLAKKGENGAPEKGGYISFSLSKTSTSI